MNRQTAGWIGAIMLAIGTLVPLYRVPVFGSINYFNNGKGDGLLVLGLAIIAMLLMIKKSYRGVFFIGLGSLLLIGTTLFRVITVTADAKDQMKKDLAGNPFAGLAEGFMTGSQIEWGFAVLLVGAILLIATRYLKDFPETATPPAAVEPPETKQ